MINLNQKFKSVVKDRLFYDRFEYSIGFQLDEISCLRELSHEHVDTFIERRRAWREISQQRQYNNNIILSRRVKDITEDTVKNLHTIADILLTTVDDFKLVVSVNQGWVYTNSLALINQIDDLPILRQKSHTKAIINRPKDTIRIKNSKHTNRSYFKIVKLTAREKELLVNFMVNQREHIRSSPSLSTWVTQEFLRTQDYFFIDHCGDSWLLLLSLVRPGLIRKTVKIIADK